MPVKKVPVPDIGMLHLYKRRGTKSIRLSVTHTGDVRVSLPMWAPYRMGIDFALRKRSWLLEKRQPLAVLRHGQRIGVGHRLVFIQQPAAARLTTRLTTNHDVRVHLPPGIDESSHEAQQAAIRVAIRALKKEAEILLPQRLAKVAAREGFTYRSVAIKRLNSRWGSCSEQKDIVLNCYLIQLPWHLIDYVILHELVHTKVMAHGHAFWDELGKHISQLPAIRKEIRQYKPIIIPQ